MEFFMLSNNLVWNYKDKEDTLLYEYGDKIPYILSYLECNKNALGYSIFCLEDMILKSGLATKRGKGNTNDKFKDILSDLVNKGIVNTDIDFSNINKNDYLEVKLNMPMKKDNEGKFIEFFTIKWADYNKIINQYRGNLSKLTLLSIFYYINSRIKKNASDEQYNKPECFYDKYTSICDDLDICENTWNTYINNLKEMEMLFFGNIGIVAKGNNENIANNVYCLKQDELPKALECSRLFYLGEGYEIKGSKFNSKDKKSSNKFDNEVKEQIYGQANNDDTNIKGEMVYDFSNMPILELQQMLFGK